MSVIDEQFDYTEFLLDIVRIEDGDTRTSLADHGQDAVAEISVLRHLIKTKDEQIEALRAKLKETGDG